MPAIDALTQNGAVDVVPGRDGTLVATCAECSKSAGFTSHETAWQWVLDHDCVVGLPTPRTSTDDAVTAD